MKNEYVHESSAVCSPHHSCPPCRRDSSEDTPTALRTALPLGMKDSGCRFCLVPLGSGLSAHPPRSGVHA